MKWAIQKVIFLITRRISYVPLKASDSDSPGSAGPGQPDEEPRAFAAGEERGTDLWRSRGGAAGARSWGAWPPAPRGLARQSCQLDQLWSFPSSAAPRGQLGKRQK